MAIKEFNVDLDVKGRVLASTVPNSTGSIVTWNTTTNVFGLRTNTQIISDLNLSSNYITTNTTQTGLTGNKTSNGIWTLGQVRKAGQNDTQMLLAGGGHRPVSDFALASEIPNVTGFIPYTGANQSIDLNTQDFTTGGYTNRLHSYFERINLASDSTSAYSNFKLLTNVASSEIGNASSQTSDIIITLPITTSTHWQAEIDILRGAYRTTLNVGGYGTVSSSRFVNGVHGDISDIIEVKFGRIGDSTMLIIKRSNSSNHRLQVNISKFYYHHTNSVDLYNDKTKYKVEYTDESELIDFTLNGVVENSQFTRDSYLWNKGDFTQDNVDDWNAAFGWGNHINKYVGGTTNPLVDPGTYSGSHSTLPLGSYTAILSSSATGFPNGADGGFFSFGRVATNISSRIFGSRSNVDGLWYSNGDSSVADIYQVASREWVKSFGIGKPITEYNNISTIERGIPGGLYSTNTTTSGGPLSRSSGSLISIGSGVSGGTNSFVWLTGNNASASRAFFTHAKTTGEMQPWEEIASQSWVNSQNFSTQTLTSSISNTISGTEVRRAALTGDVTASANSNATTIADNVVTFAKIQNIATQRFLGRVSSGTGNVEALTAAQMQSALGYLTSFTETDPTVPAHVKAITTTNISNWNTAFGWGDFRDYGLGDQVLLRDVDDQETNSINYTGQSSANNPFDYGAVFRMGSSSSYIQLYGEYVNSESLRFRRNRNGVFHPWREIWHTGNFNPSDYALSNSTSNLIVSNTVQRAALTGDVTANQNSNATTIANNAVTHTKYQNIATQRILGRGATGSGNVQELTLGSNLSLSTAGVLSATNTNTTYSEITVAESNSLTSTIGRLITGRRLNSWGNSKYLPLTGGTLEDGATPLFIKRAATQVSLGFEVGVTRRFLGINAIGDLIFGNDANINSTGNVVWHKGNLANGTTAQYIRGDGTLATFPTLPTGNATHTGDVTGATVLTIANKAVTLAKMADLAANSLIGRGSGTGVPQRLTLGNKLSISGTEINATDTTYNAGTLTLLNAGTDTTNRVWGAKPIADYVKQYAGENLGLQGVTERGNWTTNNIEVRLGNISQQQDLILMPSGSSSNPAGNAALISTGDKGFRISALRSPYLGTMATAIVSRFGMFYPSSGGTGKSASAFTIGDGSDWAFTYMTNTSGTGIGNGNKSMNINLGYTKHHSERMSKNPTLTGFSRVQSLEFPPESGTLATREWMASPGNEPPSSEPGVSLIRAGEIARYLFRNNFAINHSTKIIDAVDTKYTAGTNVSISASNVISATNTNTTYSQASLAQLKAGTNTSNRLINPMHFKEAVEYIAKPKQILVTATVSYGLDNGATFIMNGASAALGTGTLSEIDTGAEYYIYNNTNSEKSIYGGTGVTYKQSSGTTTATVKIKANGAATIIRIGSTGTFLALGDITT